MSEHQYGAGPQPGAGDDMAGPSSGTATGPGAPGAAGDSSGKAGGAPAAAGPSQGQGPANGSQPGFAPGGQAGPAPAAGPGGAIPGAYGQPGAGSHTAHRAPEGYGGQVAYVGELAQAGYGRYAPQGGYGSEAPHAGYGGYAPQLSYGGAASHAGYGGQTSQASYGGAAPHAGYAGQGGHGGQGAYQADPAMATHRAAMAAQGMGNGAAQWHPQYGAMPQPGNYGYVPPQHWPMPPAGHHSAYAPAGAAPAGTTPQGTAAGQGRRAGMAELIEELGNGGNGLSSLSRMLRLDDSEFWKGALVGAAAVLLLTNESVQDALFKTGARAKDAVEGGIDKLKERTHDAKPRTASKTSDQE